MKIDSVKSSNMSDEEIRKEAERRTLERLGYGRASNEVHFDKVMNEIIKEIRASNP